MNPGFVLSKVNSIRFMLLQYKICLEFKLFLVVNLDEFKQESDGQQRTDRCAVNPICTHYFIHVLPELLLGIKHINFEFSARKVQPVNPY